jgi:hypothetical protein
MNNFQNDETDDLDKVPGTFSASHGRIHKDKNSQDPPAVPTCRVCGCTDEDCRQCIRKTGEPCHWVEPDLCSACVEDSKGKIKQLSSVKARRRRIKPR